MPEMILSEDNNRITTQTAAVIEGLMDTKHVKLIGRDWRSRTRRDR